MQNEKKKKIIQFSNWESTENSFTAGLCKTRLQGTEQ